MAYLNIMNIGSVRATPEHNYRHFLNVVLLAVGTIVAFGWGYKTGLVKQTVDAIGTPFSVGFVVLLVAGLLIAVQESYRLSLSINRLKAENLSGNGFTYRHDWGNLNGQIKLTLNWNAVNCG